MEKLLNNITKIVVFLIMALGVAFTAWAISKSSVLKDDLELSEKILNPYFILTLITIIIAAASAILFPISQMVSNPKAAIKAGISIGILALVYLVAYSISSDDISAKVYSDFEITAQGAKLIDSLIYVVYFLSGIAIISIIGSSIIGLISKR